MKKRPAKRPPDQPDPWPTLPPEQMPKLKGLSIREPFAEFVLRRQTEEYRGVACKIRGRIYIYAGLGKYPADVAAEIAAETGLNPDDFPRGVVIGTVEVVGCTPFDDGDGFAWHFANPIRLTEPIAPSNAPSRCGSTRLEGRINPAFCG